MATNPQQSAAEAAATAQTLDGQKLLNDVIAETYGRGQQVEEQERKDFEKVLTAFMTKALEESGSLVDVDAQNLLDVWIAAVDGLLSAQLNEVLHHPSFQKLEATWRGLHYLVDQSILGEDLRIKVLNISRQDLLKDVRPRSLERSQMYHKIVESEYGQAGGKPYGILIGDYEFSYKPEDMDLLRGMSRIAAMAHAPFVAAAGPGLFNLQSYTELKGPNTYKDVFAKSAAYTEFRKFRESDEARYVALTMPRVLARLPYGQDTRKVEAFNYEEGVDGRDHGKYLWMNAAWAYAARITDAFSREGWLANTRGYNGGGRVENLPTHIFKTDSGKAVQKCPTEVQIPDWREYELSELGLLPLLHWKDTPDAAFLGAQTCQKPKTFTGPGAKDADANAALSAKLNYILCVSRFAHYLKVMARNMIGSAVPRERLEEILNDWIKMYVVEDPFKLSEYERGKYPLKDAKVEVRPVEGRPGWYEMTAFLLPHLHLEGLTASMRLVARMPASKK